MVQMNRPLMERVRTGFLSQFAKGLSIVDPVEEPADIPRYHNASGLVLTPRVTTRRTARACPCGPHGRACETTFLHASPKRRTKFVTGLVDLSGSRLLDIVEGHAGRAVSDWLQVRDEAWLSTVQRVALDPYRGYHNALVGGLDAPEVVVDAFHIVRFGNVMVDDVRRRVQQDTLGHRGR
jgi:hypothetical protein